MQSSHSLTLGINLSDMDVGEDNGIDLADAFKYSRRCRGVTLRASGETLLSRDTSSSTILSFAES